jgi:O-methyltransferase domain/Dimerisation domain
MSEVTPDLIFQVASGFMAAKYLLVANEVGLFEKLEEGPATLDVLAQRTGIPPRTMRILADALVAVSFLERQEDRYQNSAVAATFLSGRTPADLRPFLRFWNHLSYPRWTKLEEALRTSRAPFGEVSRFTVEEQELFSTGVEAITAGTAQALAATYDFSRHHRVLDLAGGTGSFLTALLNRYSSLNATLFELPAVIALAQQRLAASPLAERIQFVAGDLFNGPLPIGHDAVIVANCMDGFSPARNLDLLRRIRAHVPDEAHLLLVDFWTDPTHTKPQFAALMAAEILAYFDEGDMYSEEEMRGWLKETGWQAVEWKPLVGPQSVIVAKTAAL